MKLPELKIGQLTAKLPIIQGGMAVRISMSRLAAAVAAEGGIGIIAASGLAIDELREEIRKARDISPIGIIGVNIMVAAKEFANLARAAAEEGIDLILAGAGFSRDVFALGKETGIPIVPIVSSAKLAKISEALGASAIVVEGKEAGGHLGTDRSVRELLPEVKAAVSIPVIGAGGIIDGRDIVDLFKLGADGVQMGIRFAASEEANGSDALKAYYIKAKAEDVILIDSPVGLPGRAVRSPFSEKILAGEAPKPDECFGCLKKCTHSFCIIKALVRAQQGDVENGLIFTGEYVSRIKEILPVKEIFRRLLKEVNECDS